jgi:hypothetical protein
MKLNETFEATLWGILCIIGGITVVVGGAVWGFSRAFQSDELEGYRKARDWKVKDAIEAMTNLSSQAKLHSEERTELLQLRSDAASRKRALSEMKTNHETEISKLASQINALQKENSELRGELKSIVKESTSIEVPDGEARFVIPNTLAIAVEKIYTGFASIRIGDTEITSMQPGQRQTVNLGGKHYVVTLTKIGKDGCTFAFSESAKSD